MYDVCEIVSSDSAINLIKSVSINPVICLEMCLNIGKLDSLNNNKRDELKQYNEILKYDFNKELDEINKYKNIRIWSSIYNADDYCLLLFLCTKFKNKSISVIYSNEFNNYATTITNLTSDDLIDFSNKEHKLKNYEKEDLCNEWKNILKNNLELRYMLNGNVESVDINYFNELILDRLKELGKVIIYKLIDNLIVNPIIPKIIFSEWIYMYLIEKLENDNKITINKNDEIKFI